MQSETVGLPSEYFPLKKGLYWKYRYSGMPRQPVDIEFRISEEKEIQGKQYFRFTKWFYLTQNAVEPEIWISWQDGNIYMWDGKDEKRIFGAGMDQAELKKNDSAEVVKTETATFTDVYKFQDCLGCADAGSQYFFARGTGIVSVSMTAIWGGSKYELIETNAPEGYAR